MVCVDHSEKGGCRMRGEQEPVINLDFDIQQCLTLKVECKFSFC